MPVLLNNKAVVRAQRKTLVAKAGFIGCPTNLIMMSAIFGTMAAGRFGLIAGTRYGMNAKLKMYRKEAPFATGDPDGYNWVDVMAHASFGHIIGVGTVIGLKSIGAIPWADFV